jgi:hypothetical protein
MSKAKKSKKNGKKTTTPALIAGFLLKHYPRDAAKIAAGMLAASKGKKHSAAAFGRITKAVASASASSSASAAA